MDKNELKNLIGEFYNDFIKILKKDANDAGINFEESQDWFILKLSFLKIINEKTIKNCVKLDNKMKIPKEIKNKKNI